MQKKRKAPFDFGGTKNHPPFSEFPRSSVLRLSPLPIGTRVRAKSDRLRLIDRGVSRPTCIREKVVSHSELSLSQWNNIAERRRSRPTAGRHPGTYGLARFLIRLAQYPAKLMANQAPRATRPWARNVEPLETRSSPAALWLLPMPAAASHGESIISTQPSDHVETVRSSASERVARHFSATRVPNSFGVGQRLETSVAEQLTIETLPDPVLVDKNMAAAGLTDAPIAAPGAGLAEVPFKVRFRGTITIITPFSEGSLPACNANLPGGGGDHPGRFLTAYDNSTGHGTHFGQMKVTSSFCIGLEDPVSEGQATFLAANGDEVRASFTNTSLPINAGVFEVSGPQTIVGGTGRFEGATGQQDCHFIVQETADPFVLTINGGCDGTMILTPSIRSN